MAIKRKMFFGRIGVGKSTVAKKISKDEGRDFIDCDKEVWSHYNGDFAQIRKEFREVIETGDKEKYKELMAKFAKDIDFKSLLSKNANYEVSVLGNFYNIGVIPKELLDDFDIFKIMCYVDTRQKNLKDRNVNMEWANKLDVLFEDPKDLKYGTIFNEDILGNRT
jgi:dephospho-CoA kinase